MARGIRVTDKVYDKIKALADKNDMKVATYVSFIFNKLSKDEKNENQK